MSAHQVIMACRVRYPVIDQVGDFTRWCCRRRVLPVPPDDEKPDDEVTPNVAVVRVGEGDPRRSSLTRILGMRGAVPERRPVLGLRKA
jgi:hypothetical protein